MIEKVYTSEPKLIEIHLTVLMAKPTHACLQDPIYIVKIQMMF